MQWQSVYKNSRGFTLVELMVTVAISGMVIVLIAWIYPQFQKASTAQESVVDIQQNLRAAVYLMGQEIRMAGYDPTKNANATITAATATSISFDQDVTGNGLAPPLEDGEGAVNDANENITLTFNAAPANTITRISTTGGPAQVMIQNVQALEFRYTLKNGTISLAPAASQLGDIKTVDISLLVRAATPEPDLANNLTMTYTTASGAVWGPYMVDNFRRRLLVTTIQCRNMGL